MRTLSSFWSSNRDRPGSSVMSIRSVLLLVAAALLTAGCGGGSATPNPSGSQEGSSEPSSEAQTAESSQHAGESAGAHTGETSMQAVALTEEQMSGLGIRVDTLERGSSTSVIERPATVRFDPSRVAKVGPRVEGKIVRVEKDLGEYVEEGETIAVLSSIEIGQARSRYLSAEAHLQTRRRAYEREQTLRADSISSEAELLEARARFEEARAEFRAAEEALRLYGLTGEEVAASEESDRPLSRFRLTSPVEGILQQRDVSPGQTVGSQETPFHVADPSRMWVMIDAYERDITALSSGQAVTVSIQSLRGERFTGQVDFIANRLDEETRTVRVRAVVSNPSGLLRDGMYGRARIQTDSEVATALISTDAVQDLHGNSVVFVPGEESGHFRAVPVRLGEESQSGRVELLAGLRPGDVAVTAGAFDLKAALTASGRSASHGH